MAVAEMTPEELMEAFERSRKAVGKQPPVVQENGNTVELDLLEAYERSREASTVEVSNYTEADPDVTFFDRVFAEPMERASQRQAAINQRVATTVQNMGPAGLRRQMEMTPEQSKRFSSQTTNIPSVLVQTAANPIAMVFDGLSELVLMGAEGAVGLLPESFKEGGKEQFAKLMQTKGGQMAFAAAAQGMEEWQEFQEAYPNEAANLIAVFDIGAGRSVVDFSQTLAKEFSPQKVVQMGLRKQTAPLAGDDKYIYNVLFGRDVKTPEQVDLTQDPSGLRGVQEQLASEAQLEQIDLAKAAGVSGGKTLQQNYNALDSYLTGLEDQLMALLKRNEANVDPATLMGSLRTNLKKEFDDIVAGSSDVFKTDKAARAEITRFYKTMLNIINEQGDTLEGFRTARTRFDSRANKIPGVDLSLEILNAPSLAATAVRNAVNRSIADVVPESSALFSRMSKIIPIKKNVQLKAAREKEARFGRFMQNTGLDKMMGSTSISMALNAGLTLAGIALLSPITFVRRQMRRAGPAELKAKVAYIKRDVFDKINEAVASVSSPGERRRLLREKAAIYTYLNAAFKQVEQEMAQEENDPTKFRADGSLKSSKGFLGPIKNRATGATMTEYSTDLGDEYKGVPANEFIPTLVPGLNSAELNYLQNLGKGEKIDRSTALGKSILEKSRKHARKRIDQGLPPMYQDLEEYSDYKSMLSTRA